MTISTLEKTIIVGHDKYGKFKFEIYDEEGRYFVDISSRNNDGQWVVSKHRYALNTVVSVEEAQKSCVNYIANLGL